MGRGNRLAPYKMFFNMYEPQLERALRFTVRERILASGEVLTEFDEDSVFRLYYRLAEENVEAVGILLLHSYHDPAHEIRGKQLVQQRLPGILVSASHELSQKNKGIRARIYGGGQRLRVSGRAVALEGSALIRRTDVKGEAQAVKAARRE